MPHRFLSLPREVRDQIYNELLACCSGGIATTSPWDIEVTRSMTILRTCKQVQRECKDTIWRKNSLRLRDPSQVFRRLATFMDVDGVLQVQHIEVWLELLDRDELEWIFSGLVALSELPAVGALKSITLLAINDRPRDIKEYKQELDLIIAGDSLDGRLFTAQSSDNGKRLVLRTAWPHFLHWGRQRWLREMLMDRSDTTDLLQELQTIFKGDLYVNGMLALQAEKLDPRDGEITLVLP